MDSFISLPHSASQIGSYQKSPPPPGGWGWAGHSCPAISILCKVNSVIASDWPHSGEVSRRGGSVRILFFFILTRMLLPPLRQLLSSRRKDLQSLIWVGVSSGWSYTLAPTPRHLLLMAKGFPPYPRLQPELLLGNHTSLKSLAQGQVFTVLTSLISVNQPSFSLPSGGVCSWTQTARADLGENVCALASETEKTIWSPTKKSAIPCNML